MRDALARRGVGFLVAAPPNSSTIYQDDLPLRAQKQGRKTEYDLLLADLAARGVKAVDLRPALEKARSDAEPYLLHDTHWTARSAVLAFNAIAEADGHPDWRLDPNSSIGPPSERKGGDVARIIGIEDEVTETVRELALPSGGKTQDLSPGPMPDWVLSSGRPGPTIMVIGDSFTASYFPPMLRQHVGRVIWLNHRECGLTGTGSTSSSRRGLVDAAGTVPDLRRGRSTAQFHRDGEDHGPVGVGGTSPIRGEESGRTPASGVSPTYFPFAL